MNTPLEARYAGRLLGLACGDALGTAAEFAPRGSFAPITAIRGGGPFGLPPGYWTDDTSMALCLAASLLERSGFDAGDQMTRYLRWYRHGELSSTGACFDIGNTVRDALERFAADGEPFAGSSHPCSAGNGSLMRLAPVVPYFHGDPDAVARYAVASWRTTHVAPEALECCALLARLLENALDGGELLAAEPARYREPRVAALAAGAYRGKDREQIRGTGYCVAALGAALCRACAAS